MKTSVPTPAPRPLRCAIAALGGGIDGMFSDFANAAFAARAASLKETGR